MPRPSHATAGTYALVRRPRVGTQLDARHAFELVGSASVDVDYVDPILAARTWLANPARTAGLPTELVEQANAAIDRAELHVRELDSLAGQLAQDANATGAVDTHRLDQLDAMTATLNDFSERLRTLLDAKATDPVDAAQRIEVALAATTHAGLERLVAAL